MLISFLEKCVLAGVTVPRLTVQIGILNIIYSLKIEYFTYNNNNINNNNINWRNKERIYVKRTRD